MKHVFPRNLKRKISDPPIGTIRVSKSLRMNNQSDEERSIIFQSDVEISNIEGVLMFITKIFTNVKFF